MSQLLSVPEEHKSLIREGQRNGKQQVQQYMRRLLGQIDSHITSLQHYRESIRAMQAPQLQQQVQQVVELLENQINSQRFIQLSIRALQGDLEELGILQCLDSILEELKTAQCAFAQWTLQDLNNQQALSSNSPMLVQSNQLPHQPILPQGLQRQPPEALKTLQVSQWLPLVAKPH
jgi:hypothetical protein